MRRDSGRGRANARAVDCLASARSRSVLPRRVGPPNRAPRRSRNPLTHPKQLIPNACFIHRLGLICWFRVGGPLSVECMFDQLVDAALTSRASAAVGAWARVENAACARRLLAMAEELERMLAADGSAEREQWCLDNWDAVAASVAAAQNVSLGVAAHQLLIADALRQPAAPGGRGVRRRSDLLPDGGRGGVADPADQRPGRAGQSRHRDRRPHGGVGVIVGGENPARDRLLGRPL